MNFIMSTRIKLSLIPCSKPQAAVLSVLLLVMANLALAKDVDYQIEVKPLLTKYCVGCHNDKDNESEVQLQSIVHIRKGSPKGSLVDTKDPASSLLTKVLVGTHEPKMPPSESPQPTASEITLIQKWIEQGAKGTDDAQSLRSRLSQMNIPSTLNSTGPITAIGCVKNNSILVGRFNSVHYKQGQWSERLPFDIVGKVSQIRTTRDRRFTVVASGLPGIGGQATVLETQAGTATPKLARTIEGHQDTLYAAVLSPNAEVLATAGYDKVIMLWSMEDGRLLRKLTGHNGAVYDLDFDATGQILASASADETIKIWKVDTGERLDTLGQCEAEQYVVRFDSLRNRVLAAGADKRIRIWKILSTKTPSVSPMLYSIFAHEGSVTQLTLNSNAELLVTAGEDKSVKIWDAENGSPLGVAGELDEVPSGIIWNAEQSNLTISTLSGKLTQLDIKASLVTNNLKFAERPLSDDRVMVEVPNQSIIKLEEMTGQHNVATPQAITGPCEINSVLSLEDMSGESAGDWYSFDSKAGEPWVIQIDASRSGSPLDSVVDVLDQKGEPIVRTRLQAIRETYFTFRGKDSTNPDDFRLHRWEDMELNELLYAGGEVVKLWLYPRGPDSGFKVYPGAGTRFTFFDTTATTHALNEPAWIVRELADGEPAIPNGLPVFPIFYTNDDEASRQSGKDSLVTFTPKMDGRYLIRVRDSRGQSGDAYKYKLTLRRPMPRYQLRLEQKEVTLRPGVGTEFEITANRFDGCEGDIQIKIEGVPEGVRLSQPLSIQAGQSRAIGLLHLPAELAGTVKESTIQITSHAMVGNRKVSDEQKLSLLVKVSDKPAMQLKVVAKDQGLEAPVLSELVIRSGQTVSANVVIERGENKGDISFGGDDSGRNLPHGCYVDNIGLSGLLIPAGQSVREVFITAAPWVEPQTRLFHLRAKVDGNPTTLPIQIRVVKP
jgi:WD40 repeat protein